MTAIATFAADGFIERLPPDVQFFLVHGIDEGLAHERSKAIVRKLVGADPDPLRLVRLEGEALARRPEAFPTRPMPCRCSAAAGRSGSTRRDAISCRRWSRCSSARRAECAIVVKAAQLKKGHALRTAFEKAANAAAIECYGDEPKALGALIDAEVRNAGLAIAPDARAALVDELGADRQTSRAEIAKLILFARGQSRIELADVRAIVSDAAPSPLDELDRSGAGRRSAGGGGLRAPATSAKGATPAP